MSSPPPSSKSAEPTAPTTESPCVKICVLDMDQVCRGCGRTLDETGRWSRMTPAERIAVNQRLRFTGRER